MKLHHALFLAAAAAAGLAGCDGRDYDEPVPVVTPSNEVPPSAYVSVAAYTSYVASLQASETGSPLDVTKVVEPTSETLPPQAI